MPSRGFYTYFKGKISLICKQLHSTFQTSMHLSIYSYHIVDNVVLRPRLEPPRTAGAVQSPGETY